FRQPGGSQKSLVALQTWNSMAPANKWQQFWNAPYTTGINAGDLQIRPFLRGGKIYVVGSTGQVKAYDGGRGSPVWQMTLNCTTCKVTNNTWLEFRNGYTSTLLAVTGDGRLHSVTDTTCAGLPCGVESWCRGCTDAPGYNTEAAVDPFFSKIYIGK